MREYPVIRSEEPPLVNPNAGFYRRCAISFWIVVAALVIVWLVSWIFWQSINTDGSADDDDYRRSQQDASRP